jgi:hypothetical protein
MTNESPAVWNPPKNSSSAANTCCWRSSVHDQDKSTGDKSSASRTFLAAAMPTPAAGTKLCPYQNTGIHGERLMGDESSALSIWQAAALRPLLQQTAPCPRHPPPPGLPHAQQQQLLQQRLLQLLLLLLLLLPHSQQLPTCKQHTRRHLSTSRTIPARHTTSYKPPSSMTHHKSKCIL